MCSRGILPEKPAQPRNGLSDCFASGGISRQGCAHQLRLEFQINCYKVAGPFRLATSKSNTMCSVLPQVRIVPGNLFPRETQGPAESKGAAVFNIAGRLEREARLTLQDLTYFLRMKAVKEVSTESVLSTYAQNEAAHSMAIFLVAYYLTKNFLGIPRPAC